MSGADLYEDGFPHSTVAGYRRGCQGHSCPGLLDNGISCAQAYSRYNGDYSFRKNVDAGMTPAQITASEAATADSDDKSKRPATPREKKLAAIHWQLAVTPDLPTENVEVAPAPKPSAPKKKATMIETPADGIPFGLHGTTRGYSKGCRLGDQCPGVRLVGKSCATAVNEYQKELKAKKRGDTAPVAAALTPKPVVALVPPTPLKAAEDNRLAKLTADLEEARQQLAEALAALADRPKTVESVSILPNGATISVVVTVAGAA